MKVTIAAVPVVVGAFEIQIRDPGIVRYVAFERKQSLVMTAGRPEFEEVPVLFVEGQYEAPIRKHRFIVINHGEWCEVDDGDVATYIATGISARGAVVHVFKVMEAPS